MKKQFLSILETYMHEKAYTFPDDFNELRQLYIFSCEHKMVAAVFEQIRDSKLWDQEEYASLKAKWRRSAITDIMLQVQKEEGFLKVYQKMLAAGAKPLVVKGMICRYLYGKPDLRISSDEDILLQREDFALCDEILLSEGFVRDELSLKGGVAQLPREIPYRNFATGTFIELHFELFDSDSGAYGHLNDEFSHVFDQSVCQNIKGVEVWTLAPTDHMFYLICHAFKHFLHGGFGIRMICDMVMMAELHGASMDWNQIGEKLTRLHMDSFWAGLAEIGRVYLGFDWDKSSYPASLQEAYVGMEDLLEDLLDSGIYGSRSRERQHSANITLSAARRGKKRMSSSLKATLFPSASYMKKKYPWIRRFPFLLPIGWLVRVVEYLKGRKKRAVTNRGKEAKSGLQIGRQRVELLKKYRIIE